MSGFEIVGVVLGTIPLIIEGLKQYERGAKLVSHFRDFEITFDRLVFTLTRSAADFQQLCTRVFQSLNLPPDQLAGLLESRDYSILEDQKVVEKLQERLANILHTRFFVGSVESLGRKLEKLARRLKLDKNRRAPFIRDDDSIDENQLEKFFKDWRHRLRGSLLTDGTEKRLTEVDADIRRLKFWVEENFPASKTTLAVVRKTSVPIPKHWETIRDQAEGLFSRLDSCFKTCPCRQYHNLNLRLSARGVEDAAAATASIRFTFLFSLKPEPAMVQTGMSDWRCIHIEPHAESSPLHKPMYSSSSATRSTNRIIPAIQVGPAISNRRPATLSQPIDDLCTLLSKKHLVRSCLGSLDCKTKDRAWHHQVYTTPYEDTSSFQVTGLLNVVDKYPRQQCAIALALASAVLQLHHTQWLPQEWNTALLIFIAAEGDLATQLNIYLSHALDATPTPSTKKSIFIRNNMIFALGVALIELAFRKPISSYYLPEDYDSSGQPNEDTIYRAARRLIGSIKEVELGNYAQAVQSCVLCDFATSSCDLTQQTFRQKFFEDVVLLLMQDYEYTFGTHA